ncbi:MULTISPECIES: hypothetical protein [unclassified Rhizobium]|jgi:hypothetical protein|uniref:hypothetical protein n=1 Tax=Rhizobium sp. Rhizsp82 TaxID=3243057 RepID=UPI000DD7A0A1
MRRSAFTPPTGRHKVPATTPADIAVRYAENLRRLAREAGKMDRPVLANSLLCVARQMDDMARDNATDELGLSALRRVCRLIGRVERMLDYQAKASILH